MVTRVSPVCVTGPLAGHAGGFGVELAGWGYTPLSAANQLRVMAHMSRWLGERGLDSGDLTEERVEDFLRSRRAAGYNCWRSGRGVAPLLTYLRGRGVAPLPVVAGVRTAVDVLLGQYRVYLVGERGLVESTAGYYLAVARLFLSARVAVFDGELCLADLTAAEVAAFVVLECPRRSTGSAKILVTGLRALLRFLHVAGLVPGSLASAVPGVAGWRGGSLPRALPMAQVRALLDSCDRRRAVGRRDFAILMLLSRLGLRAGEVAALNLGDLDWGAGELAVLGKARREERLPIPVDVGEAIAGYLRWGRQAGHDEPGVFLRARAPRGRLSATGVKAAVRNAGERAGLSGCSAHRLRHTAATEMLRSGATLSEIGQVLRHRSVSTTAIYAKVDQDALRALALPWPGGVA